MGITPIISETGKVSTTYGLLMLAALAFFCLSGWVLAICGDDNRTLKRVAYFTWIASWIVMLIIYSPLLLYHPIFDLFK